MSDRLPPYPTGNLHEWALRLVDYLTNESRELEQRASPVFLQHAIDGTEKAIADGVVMYDPALGTLIFSKGGAWYPLAIAGDGAAPTMVVPFHAYNAGNMILTDSPLAARFANNQPSRMVKLVPLDGHTQVRLTGTQITTSASTNSPALRLRYRSGSYSTAIGDYLQLGATEVEFPLTGTGARDTGWIDLVPGATGDIRLALIELGGDGVADPALGHVHAFFR